MYIKRILLWSAVALWMLVIFIFSAQPATVSGSTSGGLIKVIVTFVYPDFTKMDAEAQVSLVESLQFIVRKGAHFGVYFVLGLLIYSAFSQYGFSLSEQVMLSLLSALLYAASDELHQYFIPGRAARVADILIDFIGSSASILVLTLFTAILKKKRRKTISLHNK